MAAMIITMDNVDEPGRGKIAVMAKTDCDEVETGQTPDECCIKSISISQPEPNDPSNSPSAITSIPLSTDEDVVVVDDEAASGSATTKEKKKNEVGEEEQEECCICTEPPLHPIKLPCKHIFCFLCIKGVFLLDKRCPMCRTVIPQQAIDSPVEIKPKTKKRRGADERNANGSTSRKKSKKTCRQNSTTPVSASSSSQSQSQPADDIDMASASSAAEVWFYEGRQGGWWEYDQRTNAAIQAALKTAKTLLELQIVGRIYVLDLVGQVQMQKSNPSIKRNMKRDIRTAEAKGIAGLRTK